MTLPASVDGAAKLAISPRSLQPTGPVPSSRSSVRHRRQSVLSAPAPTQHLLPPSAAAAQTQPVRPATLLPAFEPVLHAHQQCARTGLVGNKPRFSTRAIPRAVGRFALYPNPAHVDALAIHPTRAPPMTRPHAEVPFPA